MARTEKKKSQGVNLGNPSVSIGVQGTSEKTTKKKFPKDT
jgi:hypothetical protein